MDLITVTSTEIIKPLSSQTLPLHPTLKLSLIDQVCPLSYSPAILFYDTKDLDQTKIPKISAQLKQSLSHVLVPFRPVAGRIRDHSYVECNDEGVVFSEATVNCPMSEFVRTLGKGMKPLNQLIPYTPFVMQPDSSGPLMAARVTFFSGGIAVGVSSLHTTMDAVSIHTFLRSWAETTQGRSAQLALPDFTQGPTLYPQPASPPQPPLIDLQTLSMLMETFVFNDGSVNTATRKFVFKNQDIEKLKVSARSEEVPNPTRYEALSGFIWKHIMGASREGGVPKPSVAGHAVNIRRRLEPPLDGRFMGNFQNVAFATCMDGQNELPELVRRMKESMKEKNGRSFKEMQGERCYEVLSGTATKGLSEIGEVDLGSIDFVFFSSWCNMGFYDLDFGWGKPSWVGVCGEGEARSGVGNIVLFLETSSRDGIEVNMMLEEKKMAILENDPHFLKYCHANSRC